MFKSIKDFNVSSKRILIRCDFNAPLDEKGDILDDFRIRQALPTIKYLMENKAKVILMSHLGEPAGKSSPELKMNKVAERLSVLLGAEVVKLDDCIGANVERAAENLLPGKVILLENLRFHKEEEENNNEFSKQLARLGDIYVNDAFGVCHRNHASVAGAPKYLPAACGFLLFKELEALGRLIKNPARPMAVVIGGRKVETKVKFIEGVLKTADFVIISGLLKKEAAEKNIRFSQPEKIIAPEDSLDALDIDEKTRQLFCQKILQARTVLWNGPFGKFEDERYSAGTMAIANAIINSKAFSVAGGGETVEFLTRQGIIEKFSHVSTGGGAMMAYLAGEKLPGLEALKPFSHFRNICKKLKT